MCSLFNLLKLAIDNIFTKFIQTDKMSCKTLLDLKKKKAKLVFQLSRSHLDVKPNIF